METKSAFKYFSKVSPDVLNQDNHMNEGRIVLQQHRLRAGPLQLVQRPDQRWALPGGDAARYGELVLLARSCGWPQPELVIVAVKYRAEAEGDFCAPNTTTSNMADE